jgi:hypothetical protein
MQGILRFVPLLIILCHLYSCEYIVKVYRLLTDMIYMLKGLKNAKKRFFHFFVLHYDMVIKRAMHATVFLNNYEC